MFQIQLKLTISIFSTLIITEYDFGLDERR